MNNEFKKILQRETVKAYSDQKISDQDWDLIKQVIKWSPTSMGFEPYRVLTINKNHPLREQLKPLMWGQGVITEADKLVFFIAKKREVFASDKWLTERLERRISKISGKEGAEKAQMVKESLAPTKDFFVNAEPIGDAWAMKQCYIALGMALNAASLLGIGSTSIEGFDHPGLNAKFKQENLMGEQENVALALALGYPQSAKAYAHFGSGARVRDADQDKFLEI